MILSGDSGQHMAVNRGDSLRLLEQKTGIRCEREGLLAEAEMRRVHYEFLDPRVPIEHSIVPSRLLATSDVLES